MRNRPQYKKADAKPTPKPDLSNKASTAGNSKGGFSNSYIFAGILGGIIALAGAFLLQQFGVISSGNTNSTELGAKIDQIDNELKGFREKLKATAQPDVKSLTARITELEASQKSSTAELANQNNAVEVTSTKLSSSIEAAVAKVESLQQSISSGAAGENAALATLDERLKAVEASAANVAANTPSGELETLKNAVKRVG